MVGFVLAVSVGLQSSINCRSLFLIKSALGGGFAPGVSELRAGARPWHSCGTG